MSSRRSCQIIVALLAGVVGLAEAWQNQRTTAPTERFSRITRALQQANAAGLKEITLPAPQITPTGVRTLNDIVRDYSLLRVAVLDSAVSADDQTIGTWYKVKILEVLSQQTNIPEGDLPANVPTRLIPLQDSEAIYIATGGTLVINGVKVTQVPVQPGDIALRDGTQYVGGFFCESGGKRLTPVANSDGIYALTGDSLSPLGAEDSDLVREFRNYYNNRLTSLRRYLGAPSTSPR